MIKPDISQAMVDNWPPAADQYLPSIKLDLARTSDTALVSFAGIGRKNSLPIFQFAQITSRYQVHKLFIRDPHKIWYHNGLPGIAANIDEIVGFLDRLITNLGVSRKIFIGNSMGGYAALLFANLLKADEAHAFSPKTFLTPFRRLFLGDIWSWRSLMALQRSPHAQRKYFDLKPVIKNSSQNTRYHIYFSTKKWKDRAHCLPFEQVPNVTLHQFSTGGHFLVKVLKESGDLQSILANALGGTVSRPDRENGA